MFDAVITWRALAIVIDIMHGPARQNTVADAVSSEEEVEGRLSQLMLADFLERLNMAEVCGPNREFVTLKELKQNWRFLLPCALVIASILYLWYR